MRICIIGAGSTGQAAAVYIMQKGGACILNTRSEEKAAIINQDGITAEGAVSGTYRVPATTDLQTAVRGADLIIVMTIANAHKDVAIRLKPVLIPGQRVIIFNSNWGAYEFEQVLRDEIHSINLTVAETSAQLFVAQSKSPGHVNLTIKEQVSISATDAGQTQALIDTTHEIFPQFIPGSSIIETTLSSTNPVIHVPITLLNLVRIENRQPFMFYKEGVSRVAVELILNIDRERVAVAKALGCEINSVLNSINSYWEIKHDNLYDALTKNSSYLKSLGPQSLQHRYITEDIPYGIAPIARIGDLLGLNTPYTDALLNILSRVLPADLICDGVTFNQEDLFRVSSIFIRD